MMGGIGAKGNTVNILCKGPVGKGSITLLREK